jgi:CheY-like chemotaxis protein/anti-sigma regulatory factor (Ser/Thr protein kinase)
MLLRASLPTTIGIEQVLPETTKPVLADPIEMHQLVMNLCTNAAQAIGNRPGTITVVLRGLERFGPHGRGRDGIELSVRDDGAGMTDEVMARMFEPFFTTKQAGSGTGLGLAVVHGIVSQMDGEITAESSPGNGTLFRITLPCLEDPAGFSEPGQQDVPFGAGERILLAEDEDAVRMMAEKILTSLGYRVTTVNRAALALSAINDDPTAYDLLITDQTMPEMTGVDLARHVSLRAPSLPVLLMTGSRELAVEENARSAGVREIVNKPFRRAEIAHAVHRMLNGGPAS